MASDVGEVQTRLAARPDAKRVAPPGAARQSGGTRACATAPAARPAKPRAQRASGCASAARIAKATLARNAGSARPRTAPQSPRPTRFRRRTGRRHHSEEIRPPLSPVIGRDEEKHRFALESRFQADKTPNVLSYRNRQYRTVRRTLNRPRWPSSGQSSWLAIFQLHRHRRA
jgi:hypothetical protein